MYLRTLLYALRLGVMLDTPRVGSSGKPKGDDPSDSEDSMKKEGFSCSWGHVPDRLLDLYLSSLDSISLTSKVLDVYATYVDEGEVSIVVDSMHLHVPLTFTQAL